MSDTPETDAFARSIHDGVCTPNCDTWGHDPLCPVCCGEYMIADFARRLERERDALRSQVAVLRESLMSTGHGTAGCLCDSTCKICAAFNSTAETV